MSGRGPGSAALTVAATTVSVIIPCYNSALFVEGALRSLELQTVPPLEVILVDDGSTDGTAEVLARWEREPMVRVLSQANRGLSAARNAGVRAARGRWVAMLDSDDELAPDALEGLNAAMQRTPEAKWCITDVIRVRPDRSEHLESTLPQGPVEGWLLPLLQRNFIERVVFIERETLLGVGGFDERLHAYEDWELEIRLVRAAVPVVHLQRPVYHYHENSAGITRNIPLMLRELEKVLQLHHLPLARGDDPRFRHAYALRMWLLGREHLHKRGDLPKAVSCAFESLRFDFDPRRIAGALGSRFRGRTR